MYSADITVREVYRGANSEVFKIFTVNSRAQQPVGEAIEGRNRDRLANSMLAHNFSVGGLPRQYLAEDYKDNEKYRDCIYYRTNLQWKHVLP